MYSFRSYHGMLISLYFFENALIFYRIKYSVCFSNHKGKRENFRVENHLKKKDKDDNNLYLEEVWLQLNFHLVIFVESRLRDKSLGCHYTRLYFYVMYHAIIYQQ